MDVETAAGPQANPTDLGCESVYCLRSQLPFIIIFIILLLLLLMTVVMMFEWLLQ